MPLSDPATHRASPRSPAAVPLLLAALIFLVALIVTYVVADNVERSAENELEATFNYRARDLSAVLVRRMAVYEQVLQGTRGFLRGSVDVSQADFADYFAVLKLTDSFPGIEALGIAAIIPPDRLAAHIAAMRAAGFAEYEVKPAGPRDFYTSITHIQPFGGRNLRAFGYDMFSEPVRRAAMEAARDTGAAVATGRVTLVQEGARNVQSGFLMYVPVYRTGLAHVSEQERRAAIAGWVFAPFRMNDLMRGLGGEHVSDLEIEIYDGKQAIDAALLYRSPGARPAGAHAMFSHAEMIDTAGRTWLLSVRSAPQFEATLDKRPTTAIAVTGVGLGLLLSLVVWLLATERRRALQLANGMTLELRESHDRIDAERQRIRLILQNAYDAFLAVGPDGRVTDWNAQASKLFGWTEEEALGREAAELIAGPPWRERWRAHFAAFTARGECALLAGPTELKLSDRHGRAFPVEIAVTALPSDGGFGAIAFVRDIRPRKEAEEREHQRQQRLVEARLALQRSQKLEAVGKLTGGVAHDFNNILHIISANVQLMMRNEESSRKRLLNIMDAVERGKKLAEQLLAFARRQPLHPSVVNLAQLIERMDSLLHRAAGDAIRIEFALAAKLWNTLVDPNQLENVLLNLVINARDAMNNQGRITIAADNVRVDEGSELADTHIQPGEYVRVAVSDTGSGMPPEVMERAFEPFFTTKPEGKGTGLGLSMAHGFVKQSGGHIRLASTPGEGTTVTIFLPRALQEKPDPMYIRTPH
ncbi:diguanylate cyclase [Massilia sp. WF1]|uniref:CHASE domain-containing protein n=1 Tax=unclassified Massilia TaxID=2609279 RepID=UPI000649AD2F|nr:MULTISPECIES: CHASE domain-containing protein [unclassified Massilia]ALK99810.1 diguanylate cyclase [Massilia sp. WG5]KLU38783.1 diguanylate cyclase [Massilia sp. WF1]